MDKTALKPAIHEHPQFARFIDGMSGHFTQWRDSAATALKSLETECLPKQIIHQHSESLLAHYELEEVRGLIDPYAVYQHLMDYWAETMQDDCYLIAADGWVAKTQRVYENVKSGKDKGKRKDKGWACDLVPKPLIVARYFADEQAAIEAQQAEMETIAAQLTKLEEEHGGEDGAFADLDKINKAEVSNRLNELKAAPGNADLQIGPKQLKADQEVGAPGLQAAEDPTAYGAKDSPSAISHSPSEDEVLHRWLSLNKAETALKKAIKEAEAALDQLAYDKYPELTEDEIKTLVVDDKWLAHLEGAIHGEMDRISQALTQRVAELADRYDAPLPQMNDRVSELESKVNAHLEQMGFAWK